MRCARSLGLWSARAKEKEKGGEEAGAILVWGVPTWASRRAGAAVGVPREAPCGGYAQSHEYRESRRPKLFTVVYIHLHWA